MGVFFREIFGFKNNHITLENLWNQEWLANTNYVAQLVVLPVY